MKIEKKREKNMIFGRNEHFFLFLKLFFRFLIKSMAHNTSYVVNIIFSSMVILFDEIFISKNCVFAPFRQFFPFFMSFLAKPSDEFQQIEPKLVPNIFL